MKYQFELGFGTLSMRSKAARKNSVNLELELYNC